MALESIHIFVFLSLLSQVIASYVPYIQYAGTPYPTPAFIASYPVPNYASPPIPVYANPRTTSVQSLQPAPSFQPTPSFKPAPSVQPPPNFQPAPSVQQATNIQPYKTSTSPLATQTSYTQPTSSYTPTFAPTSATSTNAVSAPIAKPTAYQTTTHQQSPKTTPLASPLAPIPPTLEAIKPAPLISQETSPKASPLPKDLLTEVPPFDSNILNNLAIALQLLIVSNLIHNPPPERARDVEEDIIPAISPLPIAYVPPNIPEPVIQQHYSMPNANFLGTSSFGDTGLSKSMMNAYGSPTLPAPRPMGLMSPYDAIAPNSPYSSPFPTKVESKSPYHLSSDYNDLFALTELFRI